MGPVAQLDRAPVYGTGGQEFESLQARQINIKHEVDKKITLP